jgi:isopentenyl-diphosphate delta-isomerase
MVKIVNEYKSSHSVSCKNLIISGGVQHFLDAYYLMELSQMPSVIGMASAFLKPAMVSYESLQSFFEDQMKGLMLSKAILTIKS